MTETPADMRYVVVITDGASGDPLPEYNGQTCLEKAYTPHLDALAQEGVLGLAKNIPDNLEPSSNVACTSICGFDPEEYPIGRGALEGAALGVDLADNEVALRLNLTHVTPEGIMESYSTNNISIADGAALVGELKAALDDETFTLNIGTGFRGILVVKDHMELMEVNSTPAHNITDEPVADYPMSGPGSELLIDYAARAREVLAASPTNARRKAEGKMVSTDVFIFWPGARPGGMESFEAKYNKTAGMISGVDLLNGIAGLTGISVYHFDGITDGPDNDYVAQAEGVLSVLKEQELVFCHVEAPDAEGHDGNAPGKVEAIEAIDREILSRLRAHAEDHPLRIIVMPDHPTPVTTKRHARDFVPFVVWGPGITPDAGSRLTEAEANATGLVLNPGYQLLGKFLEEKPF